MKMRWRRPRHGLFRVFSGKGCGSLGRDEDEEESEDEDFSREKM
jgi:hypothetical protein